MQFSSFPTADFNIFLYILHCQLGELVPRTSSSTCLASNNAAFIISIDIDLDVGKELIVISNSSLQVSTYPLSGICQVPCF